MSFFLLHLLASLHRNQTSLVNLKLLRNGKKVEQVVYGREYKLIADITHPDGKFLQTIFHSKTMCLEGPPRVVIVVMIYDFSECAV